MYKVNDKEYSSDSSINQQIKTKFVEREVYCCMTSEVEYILSKSYEDREAPFSWDDIKTGEQKVCEECSYEDEFEELYPDNKEIEIKCDPEEDEENPYICPVCETTWATEGEARECCENEKLYKCQCGKVYTEDEYNNLDNVEHEIFEWWAITGWFAEKLKDHGKVILEGGCCSFWGRCTTGQAIMLDGVISRICCDMGILEGQEYEWSVK